MKTGIGLIADERARQVSGEGWTAAHDARHGSDELALAALCYATPHEYRQGMCGVGDVPECWPWENESWKPSPQDRVRELVKAGALLAAEIDRLISAHDPVELSEKKAETPPRTSVCPQCAAPVIQPRDSADYCEECGWPDDNRTPRGTVVLTYSQVRKMLEDARRTVETDPGDDVPDGYHDLNEDQTRIADACWAKGMDQFAVAVLNQVFDALRGGSGKPKEQEFFILALKHSPAQGDALWWRPLCCGYTSDLLQAGRYSESDVKQHPYHLNNETSTRAVPCEKVEPLVRHSVDWSKVRQP